VTSPALPELLGPPLPRRSRRTRRAWNAAALGACVLAGLVLFGITLIINLCARLLLKFGTANAGAVH